MNNKIKVSVCIVTYNQSKYIRQCLVSLINQDCNFQYEIIVSDDCSTDGTQDIIRQLQSEYPHLIKAFLHESNMGAYHNYLFAHQQAQGEYIAHVDGDDYYFPEKLRIQADYLTINDNCNIVWHPMLFDNGKDIYSGYARANVDFMSMHFDQRAIIQFISVGKNSSKMYRRTVRDFELPDFELVDYFANVEQVKSGLGCYASNEPLGVYRVGIGVSSTGNKTRYLLIESLKYFSKKYPQYRLEINTAILTYLLRDAKSRRSTTIIFLKLWIKTFHPLSLFKLLRGLPVMKKLNFKV